MALMGCDTLPEIGIIDIRELEEPTNETNANVTATSIAFFIAFF